MKVKDVLKQLLNDGWYLDRQSGSHKQFKHIAKKGVVTLSYHSGNDDVPIGTLKSIENQSKIKFK